MLAMNFHGTNATGTELQASKLNHFQSKSCWFVACNWCFFQDICQNHQNDPANILFRERGDAILLLLSACHCTDKGWYKRRRLNNKDHKVLLLSSCLLTLSFNMVPTQKSANGARSEKKSELLETFKKLLDTRHLRQQHQCFTENFSWT